MLAGCGSAPQQHPAVAQIPAPPPRPVDTLPVAPTKAVTHPQQASSPDPIDQLLAKTDALYKAGMDDYRAGNLEKAKDEFDSALSLLLESNQDIQSDDRLSSEFDNLVENIYGAEAAALERGDTLSPHNYEPAPIESLSGLTFPVDPKVKERAQQELKTVRSDLPLVSNDLVDGVLTYLQNHGRTYVETALKRMGAYRPLISETLRKEGVPQDLIYIAAGESAFNPLAISRVGARGMWQFMLGTGVLYGLKKDRWVDERFDPVKSTQAAARHLKELYQQFGDWYLAMAAYDSGPLFIQRAIEKTGYADFWMLRKLHALPKETEDYVPIFLATAMIGKDPKAYGFDLTPDPPLAVDKVQVGTATDLRLIAQLINHPVEDLIKLNPSLLRWTTPGNNTEFVLNLPAGTKDLFEQKIASIPPDKRVWWRTYKVESGETLSSIARKFHVSPVALAEVNQMARNSSLESGTQLVLPLAPGKESSLTRVKERGARHIMRYRVRPGDTLELIADRYDVTPYQIRRWNNLASSNLVAGRSLRLWVVGGGGSSPRRSRPRKKSKPPAPSPTKTTDQAASSTGAR